MTAEVASYEDWFLYYVALFNKSQANVYAQLALWYLLIALCEGADWANVEVRSAFGE